MSHFYIKAILTILLDLGARARQDTSVPCSVGYLTVCLHELALQEYCIEDGFYATCPEGGIMLMQEATYGRMEFGTCLQYAMGVKCQSDVLRFMDEWCSGQQTCQIDIKDFLKLTDDCPPELNGYLRARYTCLQVTNLGDQCCELPDEHVNVTLNIEYIASNVEQEAECGTLTCPLVIQAPKGQYINISIYNFNISSTATYSSSNVDLNHPRNRCFVYANIKEEGIGITAPLCVDDVRMRHLYTSSTNQVEIRINIESDGDASRFIFKFQAIGCPDPVPPENGYVDRNGQHASIRCEGFDGKRLVWEITCDQSEWQGNVGICPIGASEDTATNIVIDNKTQFSNVVAMAIIVSMAIIISIGIILTGFACMRRYRRNTGSPCRQEDSPVDWNYVYQRTNQTSQTPVNQHYKVIGNIEISHPTPILHNFGARDAVSTDIHSHHNQSSTAVKGNTKSIPNYDITEIKC